MSDLVCTSDLYLWIGTSTTLKLLSLALLSYPDPLAILSVILQVLEMNFGCCLQCTLRESDGNTRRWSCFGYRSKSPILQQIGATNSKSYQGCTMLICGIFTSVSTQTIMAKVLLSLPVAPCAVGGGTQGNLRIYGV